MNKEQTKQTKTKTKNNTDFDFSWTGISSNKMLHRHELSELTWFWTYL